MHNPSRNYLILIVILFLNSCSSSLTTTGTPAIVPTLVVMPTATNELLNPALVENYRSAFALTPLELWSMTELGAVIYPSYLETNATQDPLPVPGHVGLSLPSSNVNMMIESIHQYENSIENMLGKKPSNFFVSWNKSTGDNFSFTLYSTEKVDEKWVMFWLADISELGTLDNPMLSFKPYPAEYGVATNRKTSLIQVPLPIDADPSTLEARWWLSGNNPSLQEIPVIMIRGSGMIVFDVLKGHDEGVDNGWISQAQLGDADFPSIGNNLWQIAGVEWEKDEGPNIRILGANGDISTIPKTRVEQTSATSPTWSPDGRQLAFVIRRWDQRPPTYAMLNYSQIYIVDADDLLHPRKLSGEWSSIFSTAWSPDGNYIAFTAEQNSDITQLYVIASDGSGLRQLTNIPEGLPTFIINWTPDSKGILYPVKGGDPDIQLWMASRNNSTSPALFASFPECDWWSGHHRLSPDGKKIVYVCWFENDTSQIYVVNVDGSGLIALTNYPQSRNEFPAWSPDGDYLAFSTNRSGVWELWIMRADGSEQTLIKSAGYYETTWQP